MKDLEQKTITSCEVAEMVEKDHKELLRDIRRYSEQLGGSNIALTDFFTESTYQNSQNKELPCYLVTKKGCEFIGNKLTGIKGTEFTAKYINKFHAMQEIIQTEVIETSNLSPQLQILINMEIEQKRQAIELSEAKENSQKALDQIDSIREIVALNPNDWRKDSSSLINKMAQTSGGYEHIKPIREESYKLLEQRYGVALGIRLTNKKRTMSLNGLCKSKIDKLNQLDVIADDKKLIEGYTQIIKEMAIKYKAR